MSQTTQAEILSVTAYATRVQRVAKSVGGAVVEGEVQNPRVTGGKALMFDVTDGESCLKCKVLPWTLRDGLTHKPREGDLVRVKISHPDFWPKAGLLTVVVDDIELAGDGELLRRRQQLIERLRREGLTEPGEFPPIPRFPAAVGVIAGTDSDALKDIIRGIGDRFPAAKVVTACCQVQGVGAPQAVVAALARLDLVDEVEVIIIGRGGGGVRDLAAFDDEALCRAIRAITTPVVTAIGHTDNDPVCNHITHAAYVPRHAAELVVADRAALLLELDQAMAAANRAASGIRRRAEELDARAAVLRGRDRIAAVQGVLGQRSQILDRAAAELTSAAEGTLARAREALAQVPGRLRAQAADGQHHLNRFELAARAGASHPSRRSAELAVLAAQMTRGGQRVLRERRTNWLRALDRQGHDLLQASRRRLTGIASELERDRGELTRAGGRGLRDLGQQAATLRAVLEASDFRRRGWILATGAEGRAITSIGQVQIADRLQLHARDGTVDVVAEELHPEPKEA